MEKLKTDITNYKSGFENLIVSLHKVFLDARSKVISQKYFQSAIESGTKGLNELDRLISEIMKYLSENQEFQEDLLQFLVSYRPRLENEIHLIEDSIKNPIEYEETIHDEEIDQALQEAQTEFLQMLQEEKEKIEQAKRDQIKRKTEAEQLEAQRLFEQQQQMKELFKNYEKQQKEQQKNSWLQEGDLQDLLEMKRRNHIEEETNFGFNEYDNFNILNNSNNAYNSRNNQNNSNNDNFNYYSGNVFPKYSDIDEEGSAQNIENEQEMANRLLSQFLGIQTDDQNENSKNEEAVNNEAQNTEIENEDTKNEGVQNTEIENEVTKNEGVQNTEIENEVTKNEGVQNTEIENEENQSEEIQNENVNSNTTNEEVVNSVSVE